MSNPFLFTEEVGTTQPASNNTFNPFLAGNDFSSPSKDNPFSTNLQSSQNVFDSNSTATNPFAVGPDSGASVDFFSGAQQEEASEQSTINYENIFSESSSQPPQSDINLFGEEPPPEKPTYFLHNDMLTSAGQPSNIFSNDYDSSLDDSGKGPPRRPPPPRPEAPPGPPKETKDLILSVTGAMEATSSHLLDRLQATRTPSPTPMRDLHSPSPTQFGDLLEVDESSGITGPVSQPTHHQEVNLLGDDFDFIPSSNVQPVETNKRPSIPEGSIAPITPVPPESEHVQPVTPIPSKPAMPPSRPSPPVVPERPKIPPQPPRPPAPPRPKTPEITPSVTPQQIVPPVQPITQKETNANEFNDVFGEVIPNTYAIPAPVTLAEQPTPKEIQPESVAMNEPAETPFQEMAAANLPPINTAPSLSASVPPLSAAILPTTPPAPPPSANVFSENKDNIFDMQFSKMSSTNQPPQSNLFPDVQQETTVNNSQAENAFGDFPAAPASQSYNIFDAFNSSSQLPNEAKQDDFDAFAAKFESVGVTEVEKKIADPFDPFGAGFQASAQPVAGFYHINIIILAIILVLQSI